VVDADRDVRDLIVSGLTREGYHVAAAASGEECLAAAQAEAPDLICLEVALPDLDGFEVTRRLLAGPTTSSIPIVFVTSRAGLRDRVEGLRLGAHAYLTKPFAFPELFATLEGILQRKSAARPADPGSAPPVSRGLGLMGSLGAISLASVIQAIEAELQTGVLRVVSGTRWGQLTFHHGKIIAAAAGGLADEEAIYELVAWDTGTYAFRAETVEPRAPIAASAASVLMRALQRHDERRAASGQ